MKKTKLVLLSMSCLLAGGLCGEIVHADISESVYTSQGTVTFRPNTNPILPVDPEGDKPNIPTFPWDPTEPGGKPKPGTGGPLSIDFASSFNFGVNEISNEDRSYFARAQLILDESGTTSETRPNYVQVSDHRGTSEGWTLSVKQEGQLKADEITENSELTGSYIELSNPTVRSNSIDQAPEAVESIILDPSASEQPVLVAELEQGSGTWTNAWGEVETVTETEENGTQNEVDVTKAVKLVVPGETPKDAVEYKSVLTWILSDIPSNNEL